MFHEWLISSVLVFGIYCDNPVLEIPQGKLRGDTRTNRNGGTYYSFKNIPYATPPLGNLRFKNPVPADGWEGIRDATQEVPFCMQETGNGQEDCLYLNVYTPGLPRENVTNLPVMVYIHGGAFLIESANEANIGAQLLLTKDIIFVALNYRLGIYGFLSLDDPNLGVTGNAGMKDQVLALKWIQENIKYFGGNPKHVTISGNSAGAMCAHFHVLSPMSKGLFNQAHAISGVALSRKAVPEFRNNALLLAETLNIPKNNLSEMVTYLQHASTDDIHAAFTKWNKRYEYFVRPIIEIPSNEPTFLTDYPLNIIRSGNYNQVPMLLSFNSAEGLYDQVRSMRYTGKNILIEDFTKYIPHDLNNKLKYEEAAILSERIKMYYFGDTEPNRNNITGAVKLITDFFYGFPAYRTAIEHLKTSKYPIYFYYFNGDTELNVYKKEDELASKCPGAGHSDDYRYEYSSEPPIDVIEGSIEDLSIINQINIITNFVIYGNPSPSNIDDFKLEPVNETQFNYLQVNSGEAHQETVLPNHKNIEFWQKIYEEYY